MGLPDLQKITGADWRKAKKDAGVKGAGFFDGAAGKAVADKIDRYQQKKAAFEQAATSKNFLPMSGALSDLGTALGKAAAERSFNSDDAKKLQADIVRLHGEVDRAYVDLSKTAGDKEKMNALDEGNKDELKGIIGELGLKF